MILSKTPVLSCRTLALPKWAYDDTFNMQMGALEAVIDGPLGPLRIYGLHLGHLESEERQAQIAALRDSCPKRNGDPELDIEVARTLLFDPAHNLEERILNEQFVP